MSIIEKAKWWAYQYLRMITGKSINFFLCKIQAADWNIVSKREWENEFFRQVDQVLRQNKIVQDLPEFSQDFTEEFERIAGPNTDNQGGPNNDENSGWFSFHPNMNRTEVRVYATQAEDGDRVSTMEEIASIMKGICGENPNFPLYHTTKKEKEKENTNTSSKEKQMRSFHKNQTDGGADCIYKKGYEERGTINVQGIGGGGNLPLDKEGTLKLGIALFDCIPKAWLQTQQPQSRRRLRIYWIGCGFGEEILCICKLAKNFKFPLFILATDIEEGCVTLFQKEVDLHRLRDYVQVQTVDVYATESIGDDYDIVYTQAASGSLFTLKILSLALNCPSVQYLLCNHTHCVYVDEEENEFHQVARGRLALVAASLEAGNHRKGSRRKRGEKRWIYALDISTYAFFFTKYLSMPFIKCNIYFYIPLCNRLRSRSCLNKVRSRMLQEYNNSFDKQFGSFDQDGAFKPPTSSSYNKVSSILGSSSNVGSSISIETFHSITPNGNMSESSNRNRSQRVPQLLVTVPEMSDYRREYQTRFTDSRRQGVIQSFWSKVVYPKARDIWNQQKVMNEADNITNSSTTVNVDKLTFRGLTKQNGKDAWGSDKLGDQEEDDDDDEEEEEED
jgi:hypothetical protein